VLPGARTLHSGHLFSLLSNAVSTGKTAHKDKAYPGLHDTIIVEDLRETVQTTMAIHRCH
jgi:hypothetical protein